MLTCAHAIAARNIIVSRGGTVYGVGPAVKADQDLDLAVIKVPRFPSELAIVISMNELSGIRRFESVLTYGFPLGADIGHLTEGRISSVRDWSGLIKISSPVIYGNSGGGVFVLREGRYKLIGLVSRIQILDGPAHTVPHISWAIHAEDILAFLTH